MRIVCPAGSPLHPAAGAPSVLCGVLARANDGAELHGSTERAQVSPVMHGDQDAHVVSAYCAGCGIPGGPATYTACAVWRAGKEADWAKRKGPDRLRDEQAARPPAGVREALERR